MDSTPSDLPKQMHDMQDDSPVVPGYALLVICQCPVQVSMGAPLTHHVQQVL